MTLTEGSEHSFKLGQLNPVPTLDRAPNAVALQPDRALNVIAPKLTPVYHDGVPNNLIDCDVNPPRHVANSHNQHPFDPGGLFAQLSSTPILLAALVGTMSHLPFDNRHSGTAMASGFRLQASGFSDYNVAKAIAKKNFVLTYV